MQILLESWRYQHAHNELRLFGYVILENHLHFVAQTPRLDKCLNSFKSFTAARIIELLEQYRAEHLLARLRIAKQIHKADREYQLWQDGSHTEMIFSEPVMREKLDYTHYNPVKRATLTCRNIGVIRRVPGIIWENQGLLKLIVGFDELGRWSVETINSRRW